ncbi:PTS transporter subunit EIIC [Paenibacillus illinoisensis]|uniref:PTS transporter subunit EIIC n=1 Tax=Paenibacillus illinoisensis TaxID=59845 RepID=UPI00301C2621
MNDRQFEEILKLAGGKGNISYVKHDMNTTTLTLRNHTDVEMPRSAESILDLDIRLTGDQGYIAIKDEFALLYKRLTDLGVAKDISSPLQETRRSGKKAFSLLGFISDVFRPLMPVILGAAVLKIVLAIITLFNVYSSTDSSSLMESQTFMIFKSIGDSVNYLLPILVAFSTAYRMKSNLYVAAAIGGLMLYPQMTYLLSGQEDVHFLGVPIVSQTSFLSATIWIILAVCASSFLERVVERREPKLMKGILAPALTFLILIPLVLMVLGPLGTWVNQLFPDIIDSLLNDAPVVTIMLMAAMMSILMITGLHYLLVPIMINELMTNGFSLIIPAILIAFVAQSGASLAAGLRTKEAEFRKLAFWATGTALLGAPEPAMYAVNMRRIGYFFSAMAGGAVGGLYFGISFVKALVIGGAGSLLDIPFYIEADTLNLLHTCIGLLLAFAVSGALTYWLAGRTSHTKHV